MIQQSRPGFTLIELLVVVAIISILASIAVPNFLEAQTRSKVARVHADMRSMHLALEAYRVDNLAQPPRRLAPEEPPWVRKAPDVIYREEDLSRLSTPVAYISASPVDAFALPTLHHEDATIGDSMLIDYWDRASHISIITCIKDGNEEPLHLTWALISQGPDLTFGYPANRGNMLSPTEDSPYFLSFWFDYDATNGTISGGNIYKFEREDISATNYLQYECSSCPWELETSE